MAESAPESNRAKAIKDYFLGDSVLYDSFLMACCQQFPKDIVDGDSAREATNWAALRLIAHNLKGTLITLGYPDQHAVAKALEQSCVAGDAAQCVALWETLRSGLPRA